MNKLLSTIGFVLLLLGAGGMDSTNQLIPSVMAITGATILLAMSRKKNRPC